MAEVTLKAVKRDRVGKGPARHARRENKVPGIIYGQGMDPIPVIVDRRELVTAFHTDAGMNVLLTIEVDGQSTTALARDLQRDPLRGTLLHTDFVKVDLKQEVEVEVPPKPLRRGRRRQRGRNPRAAVIRSSRQMSSHRTSPSRSMRTCPP